MLYIRIELIDDANVESRKLLSQLTIVNDETATGRLVNYLVLLKSGTKAVRTSKVLNFPRNVGTVEDLVLLALASVRPAGGVISEIRLEGPDE